MPNTKGSERGKYDKKCRFSRKCFQEWNDSFNEATQYVYSFAVEFKDISCFLADYQQNSDLYEFLDKHLLPSEKLTAEQHLQAQKNNIKTFCSRCNKRDSYEFQDCFCKTYVAQEYLLDISILDKGNKIFRCPICHRTSFIQAGKDPQISKLQDVRLLGRPAVLLLRRDYPKCPSCGKRIGEEMVIGFQAYCDGTMTCRLAENVLFAQLSMTKRELIAEAYGISKSQIDRIKQRMLDQSKNVKRRRIRLEIDASLQLPIIHKEFKDALADKGPEDTRADHVYDCYFIQRSESRYDLIHILTQADRNALSQMKSNPEEFSQHFPDADSFYLSCFCCLAGERKMHGEELVKTLASLDRLYREVFRQPEQDEWERTVHFKTVYDSAIVEKKDPLHLLWRPRNGFSADAFQVEENGQYVFAEFSEKPLSGSSGGSGSIVEVDEFIALLCEVLRKHKTNANTLKDTLLYFNPAVITKVEMAIQTGMQYEDYDMHTLQSEGIYMARPPFGAPLPCLNHFLKNGLFDPNNEKLLPCLLSEKTRYDEKGQPVLPCGLGGDLCPHLNKR